MTNKTARIFRGNWSNSLSIKVLTVFAGTTIFLLFALWLTLGITFNTVISDNIEPYFTKHLFTLQRQLGSPPDLILAEKLTAQNSLVIAIDAPGYRWSSNGQFINDEDLDVRLQRVNDQGLVAEAGFYHGNFILRTFEHGYIVSYIITEKINAQSKIKIMAIITGLMLLVFIFLYFIIAFFFRPVKWLQSGLLRIGGGDVSYRLLENRRDEWGELAISINKMGDSIEEMLEAKRQLLLAISHELRTPITRSKLALSMLPSSSNSDSINEDLDEMEELIEELLESERLHSSHAALVLADTDINEVIHQLQGRYFDKEPLVLDLDYQIPTLYIDGKRIGLAIKNVIKNALTARIDKTDKVIVNTSVEADWLLITVTDFGCGIAAEEIPYLTDAFYRPDSSRQRKTGGVGIVLYLIKAIIEAHKGKLEISSQLGQGTVVSLLLPIRPNPV